MKGHNLKDLTAKKFGLLTVIGRSNNKNKKVYWECQCDCGKKSIVQSSKLTIGHTKSCGCLKNQGHRFIDLNGMKFNMLTVISLNSRGNKTVRWNCVCDCGGTNIVIASNLKNGSVKSCGCLGKHNLVNITHGLSKSRLANILDNMKARCYRPNTECFENYGGRGIYICDHWLLDTNNFYQWALSNGYSDDLTIERIDCNGNYCPENCKWIPQYEQSRNRRVSLGVEKVYDIKIRLNRGETSISIAKLYNVHPSTIFYIKTGKAYPYVLV